MKIVKGVSLEKTMVDKIEEMAKASNRTFSNMLSTLIQKALEKKCL